MSKTRSQPSENIWFLVYIHVPKEKRTKVNPSRRKGVFLAYSYTSKDYEIYFPRFNIINISRDATFVEELTKLHIIS